MSTNFRLHKIDIFAELDRSAIIPSDFDSLEVSSNVYEPRLMRPSHLRHCKPDIFNCRRSLGSRRSLCKASKYMCVWYTKLQKK